MLGLPLLVARRNASGLLKSSQVCFLVTTRRRAARGASPGYYVKYAAALMPQAANALIFKAAAVPSVKSEVWGSANRGA
jgi:hypothetical protein